MPNTINIPTPLRPFTDKKESVEVHGATVGELLADLTTRYEGLRKHLYADNGKLRNFVNVYLNDEDIRYLQRENTPVKSGDTLSIVPSVAGGAPWLAAVFIVSLVTAPLIARRDVTFDYLCRRVAEPQNIEETMALGREYLARVDNDAALTRAFDEIIADAKRDGMTDEGAILMTIEKRR